MGGRTIPIIMIPWTMIPNQIGSHPSLVTTGIKIGVTRIRNAISSIKEPPIRYINIMNIRKDEYLSNESA